MNKLQWAILTIPVLMLFGCASPAKTENMIFKPTDPYSYNQLLRNQVDLTKASGGEKTNPLWTSEISTEAFSEAVRNSLVSQGLFSENGRFRLQVNMKKTKQPIFGLDLTVTTFVNYILTDSSNNTVLFDETIEAPYTATVGDAFVAIKRLRLANEGSGRTNIKGLLEKLAELNINPNGISVVK